MQYGMSRPPFSLPIVRRNTRVLAVVRRLLGFDCVLRHSALVISSAGTATQRWHIDGEHLQRGVHLAPHVLNVFIPLIPLTRELGPTEFCLGSHRLSNTSLRRCTVDALVKCERVCGHMRCMMFRIRNILHALAVWRNPAMHHPFHPASTSSYTKYRSPRGSISRRACSYTHKVSQSQFAGPVFGF